MAFVSDYVMDAALAKYDTEANRLDICSQEATTYTEATTTYSLGNKTSLSIGSPADRSGGGREVTVAAFTDGSTTADGTASHWAITDTVNSRLLATGSLTAAKAVNNGDSFELSAFTIGIPDAT